MIILRLGAVKHIAHIASWAVCLSLLFIFLDPLGSRQACGDKKKQVHWTCLVFGRFGWTCVICKIKERKWLANTMEYFEIYLGWVCSKAGKGGSFWWNLRFSRVFVKLKLLCLRNDLWYSFGDKCGHFVNMAYGNMLTCTHHPMSV